MSKKLEHTIVILLVSILILVCSISLAFADSDIRENHNQLVDKIAVPTALQYNALRIQNATITDVYNLVYSIFYDSSNYAFGAMAEIINELYYYDGSSNWSIAELTGMIWGHTDNMMYDVDTIASNTDLTNRKLEYVFSAIEDTINIKWYSTQFGYSGFSTSPTNEFITTDTTGTDFYFCFNSNSADAQNVPSLYRIYIPCVPTQGTYFGYPDVDIDLKIIYNNNLYDTEFNCDYFIENTRNGMYIYLYGFRISLTAQYWFGIHADFNLNVYDLYEGYIVTVPFDTLDYQAIKAAQYAQNQDQANEAIAKLASIYASDDVIAAKAAQQEYEDEAVADFTGSGDGAATKSDKNGLKSTSSTLKSGLDTGGSVSNGLSVFDNSSSIWDWFTQTTKDNLDETQNNPIYYHIIIDSNYRRNGSYFDIPFPSIIEEGFVVRLEFHFYETYTGNSRVRWRQNDTAGNTIGYLTDASLDFTWDSAPNRDATNIRIYDYIPNTLFHLRISYYDPENLNRSGSQDIILDFYNPNSKSIDDMVKENDRSNSERR